MINIREICRKNRETFYNYATNEQKSLIPQRIIKGLLAVFFTLLFFEITSPFFSTVITIYSILIGFSFSILFFLLSINFENVKDSKIPEIKLMKKKLNKLLKELFYNVSYFNLLSVSLIFMALISFMPNGTSEWLDKIINKNSNLVEYQAALGILVLFIKAFYLLSFYYLLVNSIYSLLRTTERVSYFFQEKLLLKNQEK